MVTKRNPDAKGYTFTKFDDGDLRYLAGIIDGEGCFFICKLKKHPKDGYINDHYRGILNVTNCDCRLPEWLI